MVKAKKRSFKIGIQNKFQNITREEALKYIAENIANKTDVIDTITLFGFTAEELLEAGAPYEDVMALGNIV